VSNLPGVNEFWDIASPRLFTGLRDTAGAGWQIDWRDVYPGPGSDYIRNHDQAAFLGVLDGTESVSDWNPWEGQTAPRIGRAIRHGYGPNGLQEFSQADPQAIDCLSHDPDHCQVQLSGVGSVAGMIPFLDLPDHGQHLDPSALAGYGDLGGILPYHYDYGLQIDQGSAIGPRQVFRSPPSVSDQTAAVYAAGF